MTKKKIEIEKAIFAGGCFWCMIPPFENIDGVLEVVPGYIGGKTKNPSYEAVSTGKTGYLESVQIIYDPKKVKYRALLETFWKQIDPEDFGGQFADRGSQYKTAIFYHSKEQKEKALKSKQKIEKMKKFKEIATEIKKASTFYVAEPYHKDYHKKYPLQYKAYKKMSGREDFIKRTWGSK